MKRNKEEYKDADAINRARNAEADRIIIIGAVPVDQDRIASGRAVQMRKLRDQADHRHGDEHVRPVLEPTERPVTAPGALPQTVEFQAAVPSLVETPRAGPLRHLRDGRPLLVDCQVQAAQTA